MLNKKGVKLQKMLEPIKKIKEAVSSGKKIEAESEE
jgi:hypothetical protein